MPAGNVIHKKGENFKWNLLTIEITESKIEAMTDSEKLTTLIKHCVSEMLKCSIDRVRFYTATAKRVLLMLADSIIGQSRGFGL